MRKNKVMVKIFGIISLSTTRAIEIEAKSIKEVLRLLENHYKALEYSVTKNALIYVNSTEISKLKGLNTKLETGDVIHIMFPASGG